MKQVASLLTFGLVALAAQADETQKCERTKVAVLYDHPLWLAHGRLEETRTDNRQGCGCGRSHSGGKFAVIPRMGPLFTYSMLMNAQNRNHSRIMGLMTFSWLSTKTALEAVCMMLPSAAGQMAIRILSKQERTG